MQGIVLDQNIFYLFLAIMTIVMGFQARLLLRIRNILQALAINTDTAVQYVRKIAAIEKMAGTNQNISQTSQTCQFCKHRLAYINITKGLHTQEDFYHKCGLRDCAISLDDSCPLFEEDKDTF